jgi:CheY-like chemotaxis protein/signal transduction histidine kinase
MFLQFLQRALSYGVHERMEQSVVNRMIRINFYYMVLIIMLTLSIIYALFSGLAMLLLVNGVTLGIALAFYFILTNEKRANLGSMLALVLTATIFLNGFIFDMGVSDPLILALYFLFPLGAVSISGRKGIYVPAGLGLVTILLNSLPGLETAVQLELFSALIFFTIYAMVILVSLYIEHSNRELLTGLIRSKNIAENEAVQKDEFIGALSHKLRTSLSNIALINSLVNDKRVGPDQKDLMETLKESTNLLIEDVNNIVEIASPGIMDYKRSIVSFDLATVLDKSVSILTSGDSFSEEVIITRTDNLDHFIIGDPSLVRSLAVNIIKGLDSFKPDHRPVELIVRNLKETPSQIRLQFEFRIKTKRGEVLAERVKKLHQDEGPQGSSLANASALLLESESSLLASHDTDHAALLFFLDFTKDPTKQIIAPPDAPSDEKPKKSGTSLDQARILLVEDNAINQKIVLLSLSKQVAQIDVAVNGKKALEMFGLKQYDLVLMDIMMPVMDGITATKKIREIESTGDSHIPIVAVTANALAGDRENCLAAGADDYIAKPFTADLLIMKMKNLLA